MTLGLRITSGGINDKYGGKDNSIRTSTGSGINNDGAGHLGEVRKWE